MTAEGIVARGLNNRSSNFRDSAGNSNAHAAVEVRHRFEETHMKMTRWASAAILSIAIVAPSAVMAETVVVEHRGPHWHHGWHHHHDWRPRWHRDWHHRHHRHETVIIRR
jgi:hypothetical protein